MKSYFWGAIFAPLFCVHTFGKMRLTLFFVLLFSMNSLYSQKFEEFYSIPKSEFKETLKTAPTLCDLNAGSWVNSEMAKMEKEHYGKVTVVHFGTFDNFMSTADMEDLSQLQKEFPHIRVIISLNPKFGYPKDEKDILFELEKRQIPLPVYMDKGFKLWECMGIELWPTTMFFGPQGSLLETHEGRLNLPELRMSLPEVINRLGPYLDRHAEPFYGMPPGRWNKRTVLEYPAGLAVNEGESMIFVSDQLGDRVLGLTIDGNVMYCIGNGEKGFKDGTLEQAALNGPRGMAMDSENFILYIADTDNHAVRKVDLINDEVTTIMGVGRPPRKMPKKIVGLNSAINSPTDLLLDGNDLYISMQGSNQIWKMDLRTEVAEPIAGTEVFGFSNGEALKSQLASPSGLANDVSGAVFFTDAQASSLRYVDGDKVRTSVGEGIFTYGYADGKKEDVKLRYPNGIVAYDNKIYLADTYNHCIRSIEPFKERSETVAGNPDIAGYRNGFNPLFNQPMDVAMLRNILIIADAGNGAIRTLNLETGEARSIGLINYECVGRGKGNGLMDLRDGAELILGNGLNEITYNLDLGPNYELDPTAFQDVNLNTRTPGVELVEYDFSDGQVQLTFIPDPSVRRQAFTLELSLFIRSISDPSRQYRKEVSFYHQINMEEQAGFNHVISTFYDPEKGRE
jgi:DNA-binding beta-propeller fold protein YncE